MYLFAKNKHFLAKILQTMRPESGFRIARNRSQIGKMSYVTNFQHDVIVNFFDIVLFLLSSFVTGPSFMSISSSVLGL